MILNKKSCRYEKINKPVKKLPHKLTEMKPIDIAEDEMNKHHKHHHKSSHFNYVMPHYNVNIQFVVFNKSSDKPYPGKGQQEEIPDDKIELFKPLSLIHEWRKKLDDQWIAPFELDGYHWQTVEHYFQANKFKKFTDIYYLFTLESNSAICKDPLLANHAGSDDGKINRRKFRPNHITIDKKFDTISRSVLMNAQYAKFSQNKELKKILQLTRDAMIFEFKFNMKQQMNTLMRVRDVLFN
jgi:predicted NAD-dependent protein-ADP-ribosyltransferase YbiA (DUF1768 family)